LRNTMNNLMELMIYQN